MPTQPIAQLGDLLFVRWEDSAGCPMGWVPREQARSTEAAVVESVGWVLAVSAQALQLAPHVVVSGADGVQGHMVIPRSCVLHMRVLERAATSSCSSPASVPKRRRFSVPESI